MKLTTEQFEALLPYRSNFETMVRSQWARNPGSAALDTMSAIYSDVSGEKQNLNKGCQHCIMNLIHDLGVIFLADLEERYRREVAVAQTETTAPAKVAVKTTRKRTTKKA